MVVEDLTTLAAANTTRQTHASTSVAETLTFMHGKHTTRFGGEIRSFQRNTISNATQMNFNRLITANPQSPNGNGYGVATFLLGAVNDGYLSTNVKEYWRAKYYALFVQNDWNVHRRLTLNLGLRYDVETEPYEKYNRRSNFNISQVNPLTGLPGVLQYAGVDFGRSPVPADKNNFGPRIGFAYTADSSNRTVIRGSYGIYYLPGFETFQEAAGWSATTALSNTSVGIQPTFYLSQGPVVRGSTARQRHGAGGLPGRDRNLPPGRHPHLVLPAVEHGGATVPPRRLDGGSRLHGVRRARSWAWAARTRRSTSTTRSISPWDSICRRRCRTRSTSSAPLAPRWRGRSCCGRFRRTRTWRCSSRTGAPRSTTACS